MSLDRGKPARQRHGVGPNDSLSIHFLTPTAASGKPERNHR